MESLIKKPIFSSAYKILLYKGFKAEDVHMQLLYDIVKKHYPMSSFLSNLLQLKQLLTDCIDDKVISLMFVIVGVGSDIILFDDNYNLMQCAKCIPLHYQLLILGLDYDLITKTQEFIDSLIDSDRAFIKYFTVAISPNRRKAIDFLNTYFAFKITHLSDNVRKKTLPCNDKYTSFDKGRAIINVKNSRIVSAIPGNQFKRIFYRVSMNEWREDLRLKSVDNLEYFEQNNEVTQKMVKRSLISPNTVKYAIKNQSWIFQTLSKYLADEASLEKLRCATLKIVVQLHVEPTNHYIYSDFINTFGVKHYKLIALILFFREEIIQNTYYVIEAINDKGVDILEDEFNDDDIFDLLSSDQAPINKTGKQLSYATDFHKPVLENAFKVTDLSRKYKSQYESSLEQCKRRIFFRDMFPKETRKAEAVLEQTFRRNNHKQLSTSANNCDRQIYIGDEIIDNKARSTPPLVVIGDIGYETDNWTILPSQHKSRSFINAKFNCKLRDTSKENVVLIGKKRDNKTSSITHKKSYPSSAVYRSIEDKLSSGESSSLPTLSESNEDIDELLRQELYDNDEDYLTDSMYERILLADEKHYPAPLTKSQFLDLPIKTNESPVSGENIIKIKKSKSESNISDPEYQQDLRIDFSASGDSAQTNFNWLMENCQMLPLTLYDNYEEVVQAVLTFSKESKDVDDFVTKMADTFGYEFLELYTQIAQHRNQLKAHKSITMPQSNKEGIPVKKCVSAPSVLKTPSLGAQVIVQSETEKRFQKEVVKERKRLRKQQKLAIMVGQDEGLAEEIAQTAMRLNQCENQYEVAYHTPIFSSAKIKLDELDSYPHVYSSRKMISVADFSNFALPEGTKVHDENDFHRVDIPALISNESQKSIVNCENITYSELKNMNPWLEELFSKIEKLNIIQSRVFDTAFNTNDNMLICAPTGAGKTNIALLTIARCLNFYSLDLQNVDPDFKIVYIAPIKALASEMTENFRSRLINTSVKVREYTGDMQLSPKQLAETHILVSTPEKWDISSRKIDHEKALANQVRLIIIDEIHLLNTDRGHVIEAIVARTLRLVESSQTMIRLVGLSATLPNFLDVAQFLRVPLERGLYYFDQRFRSVPLETSFIGVTDMRLSLDEICFKEVISSLRSGNQVMVFVHTRRGTVTTAENIWRTALNRNLEALFAPPDKLAVGYLRAKTVVQTSAFKEFRELFPCGIGMHHAGVSRTDRNHIEKYFLEGYIRVLVTTSTLAWGVNLPAHTVIIKGTEVFAGGTTRDLDILDIQQIFGRAGRPQFDVSGHAILITERAKLHNYLRLMTNNVPIESVFMKNLPDHLNAEITLGTVATIDEAITWLHYTYLYIRMKKNPLVYGITYEQLIQDPTLIMHRRMLVVDAAKKLQAANLLRVSLRQGTFVATDFGRIASQYYISYGSMQDFIQVIKEKSVLLDHEAFKLISSASEFQEIRVREEEQAYLELLNTNCCLMPVADITTVCGKVSILLQSYLSRKRIESSSLQSDLNYIVMCVPRLVRAFFETCLRIHNGTLAFQFHTLALMFENVQWDIETPLRQFQCLTLPVIEKIEDQHLSVEQIRDMDVESVGRLIRHQKEGGLVKKLADNFPFADIQIRCYPITNHVVRAEIFVSANFLWEKQIHGHCQAYHLWVENSENATILHHEFFTLVSYKNKKPETSVYITVPLGDKPPPMLVFHVVNDKVLGATTTDFISLSDIILPNLKSVETDLLPLDPLSKSVLRNSRYESILSFSFLNPIQTQMFHSVYYTDMNILLGAPTGCGKTFIAELAIFRMLNHKTARKAIYIAPLKALVRERFQDWSERFGRIGIKVIQCTGDTAPAGSLLNKANVIIATPEKWDVISRGWALRDYVRDVGLIIIDEIHLLGEERGPVIEAVIARANLIASNLSGSIRFVGLSATIAYCAEMASWLGVPGNGLYNFRQFVRPVALEVHISGFPGNHYCPRMALMNKPTFQAIQDHAPDHPTIVFVSSRRQTRLTAMELISLLQRNENDNKHIWLHIPLEEMNEIISIVVDDTLKDSLLFGVGVHHAGLIDTDRKLVEKLFYEHKIQIIVATATLAWGVNFPARLVVIKGTEFYDGKIGKYVDMPISDILQMMGRAGRPQFDTKGVAVVLVSENKKNFYKKFLFEPFPVESHMLEALPNHVCAETAAGAIKNFNDIYKYISWTYLYRRLRKNPTYYGLLAVDEDSINSYVLQLVNDTVKVLEQHQCLTSDEEENTIVPTEPGIIAARYYLKYQTVLQMVEKIEESLEPCEILETLADMYEFALVPVRHNEEFMNESLAERCRKKPTNEDYFSSHVKAFLLLQAHLNDLEMPCQDYITDLKSVLEQMPRIVQAFIDYAAHKKWLPLAVRCTKILPMLTQRQWFDENPLLQLPTIDRINLPYLEDILKVSESDIPRHFHRIIAEAKGNSPAYRLWLEECFFDVSDEEQAEVTHFLRHLPAIYVQFKFNEINRSSTIVAKPDSDQITIKLKPETTFEVSILIQSIGPFEPYIMTKNEKTNKKHGYLIFVDNMEALDNSTTVIRTTFSDNRRAHGKFEIVSPETKEINVYDIYLISDTYFGIDQHYTLVLQADDLNENVSNTTK